MPNHAVISPSAFSRYMLCPGALDASAHITPTTSAAAEEGTAAHWLLFEWMLEGHKPKQGMKAPNGVTITKEMIHHLEPCKEYIKEQPGVHYYEQRVQVGRALMLSDPDLIWGTADCIIKDHDNDTLTVIDLKYGWTPVKAEDNAQLILYAIGAGGLAYEHIDIAIMQPRVSSELDIVSLTNADLVGYRDRILDVIQSIQRADAPRIPGEEQCRWCPASGVCKPHLDWAIREDFTSLDPEEMTNDELAELLTREDAIKKALDSAKAHALARAQCGQSIPGFKLVRSRKHRTWYTKDTEELLTTFREMRLPINYLMPRKPITPAAALKEFPKLSILIRQPEGSPTLVPQSDPREEIASDFEVL